MLSTNQPTVNRPLTTAHTPARTSETRVLFDATRPARFIRPLTPATFAAGLVEPPIPAASLNPATAFDAAHQRAWEAGYRIGRAQVSTAKIKLYQAPELRTTFWKAYDSGFRAAARESAARLAELDARVDAMYAERFGPEAEWHEDEIRRARALATA